MLTKVGSRFVMLLGSFLALFTAIHRSGHEAMNGARHTEEGMEAISTPHLADTRESPVVTVAQEKQRAQIEPPPMFPPMQHDPWSWFEDDSGDLAQQLAQQVSQRLKNSFLLVINDARHQAMAEYRSMCDHLVLARISSGFFI